MSFGEKIYLAMVLTMFASFVVLMATLCWLDAKDSRIQKMRNKARQETHKPGTFVAGNAAAHH